MSLSRLLVSLSAALGLCALARAQTFTWTQQAPLPTGADLHAVQMPSPSEIWTTGGNPGKVFHSTDAGLHWQTTQLNTDSLWALFFLDSQHGWAAGNGFFHTSNGGQVWVQDNSFGSVYDLFFLDAQHGWACGNGGVAYRTVDGGLNWAYSTVGPITTLSSIFFVSASLGWTLNIDGEIYKSTDGGATWTPNHSSGGHYLSTLRFFDSQEGWAIGGDTFLHTTNGGQSWTAAAVPIGTWSHGADFADRLHGISVGEYGNITVTSDGGQSWSTIQPIGSGPRLWAVRFADASHATYCGETGGIEYSADAGHSWTNLQSGGMGNTHALDAVDAMHAWAANDGFEVLRTVDGGAHWERTGVTGFDEYSRIQDVDFVDTSNGWAVGRQEFFGGGTGHIAHSIDGGSTWQIQFSANDAYFDSVKAIDAQTAFAFGWVPPPFAQSYWMRTIDGGQTWTNLATGPSASASVDFVDRNTGWMVQGSGISKTVDGGMHWTLETYAPQLLNAVSFADAQNGWAVGWSGLVMHTTNGGQTWSAQDAHNAAMVMFAVQALSPSTAWISGGGGFVARTTNGGASWQAETVPGADPTWPFEALAFVDADHGWIGGAGIWKRDGPGGCTSPLPYCTAKPNSSGGLASLGWSGIPSASVGPFAVTASGGLPNKLGLFFFSAAGPASVPFNHGTLCLQTPLSRLPVLHLDASGSAFQPVGVTPPMVGTTRWYQLFYRDPQNADGTGLGLSNGLAVTFCN